MKAPAANAPERIRQPAIEAGLRCLDCDRQWIVVTSDGEVDRTCPYCGEGPGKRTR